MLRARTYLSNMTELRMVTLVLMHNSPEKASVDIIEMHGEDKLGGGPTSLACAVNERMTSLCS